MTDPSTPKFLTLQELAQASRLSIATLHRLKQRGVLPYFQPSGKGGRLLFPRDAIERAAAAVDGDAASTPRLDSDRRGPAGPKPKWMK